MSVRPGNSVTMLLVVVRHGVVVAVGGDQSHVQKFGQFDRIVAGLRIYDTPSRQQQGSPRLTQQRGRLLDGLGISLDPPVYRSVSLRRLYVGIQALAVDQVSGYVEKYRSLLAGEGMTEGIMEHLRYSFGLVHL